MLKKRMVHLAWALFSLVLAWIFFLSYIHSPGLTSILLMISLLGFAVLNFKLGFFLKKSQAKGGKKPPAKAPAGKAPPPKAPAAKK